VPQVPVSLLEERLVKYWQKRLQPITTQLGLTSLEEVVAVL
jgi:hypothetical protein